MSENITLGSFNTLQNSSIIATLNANNSILTTALADCLSLSGSQPNQMLANLDMNSQQIINLPAPATLNSPIRLQDLQLAQIGNPGSIYGLLTGNNTWTGLNTFTKTVTMPAAIFASVTTAMETINGGVLGDASPCLIVNATLSPTPSATVQPGVLYNITSGANTSTTVQTALRVLLLPGYTGTFITTAGNHNNSCLGQGVTLVPAAGTNFPFANYGDLAQATGTTIGINIGVVGASLGGSVNVGLAGISQIAANSVTNIGIMGTGINTGTSPVFVGGWFHLNQTTVPTVSAALIADNGSQSAPIFLARANSVTKITITSAGNLQAAAGIDSSAIGANTPSTGAFTTLSTTGIFTSSNGAVATPSIVAANSSTTGISFPAASQFAISIAGVNKLDFGASGNGAAWTIPASANFFCGGILLAQGSVAVTAPTNGAVRVTGGLGATGTIWGGGGLGLVAPSTQAGTSFSTDLLHFCYITSNAGAVTVTLPAASSNTGYTYLFKQIGAGAVSSATSNVSPIGSATPGTAITASSGKYALMQSDGTNWIIIAAN